MRYQVELADQLGNLLSRCTGKALNPGSCIPTPISDAFDSSDLALMDRIDRLSGTLVSFISK
jgi:hypothetical protein